MKNIHILPTDKPSLVAMLPGKELTYSKTKQLFTPTVDWKTQNIYITSDEEIKVNDYITDGYLVWKWKDDSSLLGRKKVILTTDQDLIKDGVQAINDEFLEWFVKNPSCEVVKIEKEKVILGQVAGTTYTDFNYKIIIPKEDPKYTTSNLDNEKYKDYSVAKQRAKNYMSLKGALEPKQETLEEAAKKQWGNVHRTGVLGFIDGAKWQEERMYSEEEVIELLQKALTHKDNGETGNLITAQGEIRTANFYSWFEQFKKK